LDEMQFKIFLYLKERGEALEEITNNRFHLYGVTIMFVSFLDCWRTE